MTMRVNPRVCGRGLVILSVLSVGGCSEPTKIEALRGNMSPEFETVALSHEQRLNRQARAIDTTARQFHDDWDGFFLIDRPLRLSIYPIP